MTLKIAFYKGKKRLADRLICRWLRGPYSHCETITHSHDDGTHTCWSASLKDGGVRGKTMALDPLKWDIVEIPGSAEDARDWFEHRNGKKYDWVGTLGFIWRPLRGASDRFFCSEAVAASIGVTEPWRFDPNSLAGLVVAMTLNPTTN